MLAQLVRAAIANLPPGPLTPNALENCAELRELIADLQECVGVRYNAQQQQCQLLGVAPPQKEEENTVGIDDRLATKSCVKSKKICSSPFQFDVHEQKILVGFAREVVPAESPQQCLSACLDAVDTFGFECESVMYYPVDAECILNTEDRLDRPDLFVDEHEDTVIYLDNNCAGSQCYAPYVTQYVAAQGKQLVDELDQKFDGMELAECEELCTQRLSITANDFNCKAFMYNNESRSCILSDERSKPLGRANLTNANDWTYYEKKCFASPRTCRNVPSFTRVPQMLLVGFAAFVMENVPSVTMCLDQCTNPPPETGQNFVCKSVMYYYNEQECILNGESRQTKPDLFIPEEDDFVVDYFDINCRLESEQCTDGRVAKLVRTLNAALPEGDGAIHVLETVQAGVQECAQKCVEHAPDKCRSFNFDKSSGVCNLLYLDGRGSLRPEPKALIDLYDVHCLNDPQQQHLADAAPIGSTSCVDPDGAIFSRHLYTRWVANSPSKEQAGVPLSKCLNLCASAGERCEGVNYNRRNGNCQQFNALANSAQNSGGQQEKSDHVDFYRNVCQVKELSTAESSAANVPKLAPNGGNSPIKGSTSKPHAFPNRTVVTKKPSIKPDIRSQPTKSPKIPVIPQVGGPEISKVHGTPTHEQDKNDVSTDETSSPSSVSGKIEVSNEGPDPHSLPTPVLIPANEVHTICNYEGISVQIKHTQPFSGVVFVKNKYDTCRVEVEAKDSVTLVLGLPANFGMKPISLNPSNPSAGNTRKNAKAHADATLALEAHKNETLPDDTSSSAETAAELVASAEQMPTAVAQRRHRQRSRRQLQRDCGLQDMDNGTYKTVVVVQTNNLGIPGLVTSMDQLYEISCNYSSMLGGKVQAAAALSVQGPAPSLIQPRGKIELGNPVLMQMSPFHSDNQDDDDDKIPSGPLVQAKLGDILELRWEIMAMDDELDFLVRDCHAEPGISPAATTKGNTNGVAQQQQPSERLQLIEGGCPTPAVAQKLIPNPIQVQSTAVKVAHLQAFRFDSSSTVRITCHLELCRGDCKPVNCNMLHGVKESWGRKKRAAAITDDNVTEFETRRFKVPRFAQATTSLVIIDPLQKFTEPVAAAAVSHSTHSRLGADLSLMATTTKDQNGQQQQQQKYAAENGNVMSNENNNNNNSNSTDVVMKKTAMLAAKTAATIPGELCLHKWTLGGVLGTLMALILAQSAVVAKYMFNRLFGTTTPNVDGTRSSRLQQ